MRILLVEDDKLVAVGLLEALERQGFAVDHLTAAEPAQGALARPGYDAAIVDIGLPAMDGLELIRRWRQQGLPTPVLILTARDAVEDRVTGLDLGADDYLVKPVQLPELFARLRALIRRARSAIASEITVGSICLDLASRSAAVGERQLDLTGREYEILEQLALVSPKVVAKNALTGTLGERDNELSPNAIELYVSRLRHKLAGTGVVIRTLRGIGYRLEETGDAESH